MTHRSTVQIENPDQNKCKVSGANSFRSVRDQISLKMFSANILSPTGLIKESFQRIILPILPHRTFFNNPASWSIENQMNNALPTIWSSGTKPQ